MAEFIYVLDRARKAHGDKVILDDVTMGFFPGAKIGVVGPNGMGKSTLLNACVGEKVAITSPVAQTTRRRMRAVVNTPDAQLVIVDTPGLRGFGLVDLKKEEIALYFPEMLKVSENCRLTPRAGPYRKTRITPQELPITSDPLPTERICRIFSILPVREFRTSGIFHGTRRG